MSTKNNTTLLEARLTIVEATLKMVQEELAELKGGDAVVSEKKQKGERKKRDPDAPKRERSDKQKAQDEWRDHIKAFVSDDDKKNMKDAGFKGNIMFTLGAYIKETGAEEITAEVVGAAVKHLVANPDYKSKSQKDKSEKSSVSGSDTEKKPRGRPKKEKSDEKKTIEVVSPSDDGGEEKADEWEFAGEQFYKLNKSNAVIDKDFEYVGMFDGKRIDRKAPMPDIVKKYLSQFD
jgi:FtsZ-binding cell division protein ZapB